MNWKVKLWILKGFILKKKKKHSNQSVNEHCRKWNVLEINQNAFNEEKLNLNFCLIEEEMRLHFKVIIRKKNNSVASEKENAK